MHVYTIFDQDSENDASSTDSQPNCVSQDIILQLLCQAHLFSFNCEFDFEIVTAIHAHTKRMCG